MSLIVILALSSICVLVSSLKIRSLLAELHSVETFAATGLASGRLNKGIIELSLERSLTQLTLNLQEPITSEFRGMLDDQRRLSDAVFDDVEKNLLNQGVLTRSAEFSAVLQSLRNKIQTLRSEADGELARAAVERSPEKVTNLPLNMKTVIKRLAASTLMLRPEGVRLPSEIVTLKYIQRYAWEVREYGGQERTYFAIATAANEPIADNTLSEMNTLHRRGGVAIRNLSLSAEGREGGGKLVSDIRQMIEFYNGRYSDVREAIALSSAQSEPYTFDFQSYFDLSSEALGRAISLSYDANERIELALSKMLEDAHQQIQPYSAIILATVLLYIYLGYYMWSKISGRIQHIADLMTALANGDTSVKSRFLTANDEIGRMAQCVEIFKKNTLQRKSLEEESRLLSELNEWLHLSKSLDELFENSRPFLEKLLPETDGAIYIYSNSRDVLDGVAVWRHGEVHAHIRPGDCWALRRGRSYTYGFREIGFRCSHDNQKEQDAPSTCFPILADGETVGLMHLSLTQGGDREGFRASLRLARTCAEHLALAIANVQLRDELHNQSVRDPLTGLYNRRFLTDTLLSAIQESRHTSAPLSIVSIDVDHFKRFNDEFGHDAGDTVLRELATILADDTGGNDIACRNGGEEFMLVWPGTDTDAAHVRAEGIRQRVEGQTVRYNDGTLPKVTVSLGIASYGVHGSGIQELMRAADDALYEAKHAGRNQCVIASANRGVAAQSEAENADASQSLTLITA